MRLYGTYLIVASLGLWSLGSGHALAAEPAQTNSAPAIDSLIEPLRQKLRDNPDDMGNWVLLAQSYDYLGRRDEALDAFARARALGYEGDAPPAATRHSTPADPVLMDWMAKTIKQPLPDTPDRSDQP